MIVETAISYLLSYYYYSPYWDEDQIEPPHSALSCPSKTTVIFEQIRTISQRVFKYWKVKLNRLHFLALHWMASVIYMLCSGKQLGLLGF